MNELVATKARLYMNDFELKVPKSTEECLTAIKINVPNYYTLTEKFRQPEYCYKIREKDALIISNKMGRKNVVLKLKLIRNNDNETLLFGSFRNNILLF